MSELSPLSLPPLSGSIEIDWGPLARSFDQAKAAATQAAGAISRSVSDVQLKPPHIDLAPIRAEAAQLASVVAESVAGAAPVIEPPAMDFERATTQAESLGMAMSQAV